MQNIYLAPLPLPSSITSPVNQVQTLSMTGGPPSGGSFVINVDATMRAAYPTSRTDGGYAIKAAATTPIPYNSDIVHLQQALDAVFGKDNVTGESNALAAGGPLPSDTTITFQHQLAGFDWAALTTTDSLTGGGATAIAITTHGVAATYRGAKGGTIGYDATNGVLYENTGTQQAPVWTAVHP